VGLLPDMVRESAGGESAGVYDLPGQTREAWQRDTHGRLTAFPRNVNNEPPADPVSGRISYGIRNQAAGLGNSMAATEEEVTDTLEEVVEHRPAADAERLRDEAGSARQRAAKERGVSNQLTIAAAVQAGFGLIKTVRGEGYWLAGN